MKICHLFCKPFSNSAELLLATVDLVKYFMTFFIITFFYLFGTVLFTSCLLYFYPWKYFIKLKKTIMAPFLWMVFNCLKATEPLQGDSLLFTIHFPGIPGTHLIDLWSMKGWVVFGAAWRFWIWGPWIRNPALWIAPIILHSYTGCFRKRNTLSKRQKYKGRK